MTGDLLDVALLTTSSNLFPLAFETSPTQTGRNETQPKDGQMSRSRHAELDPSALGICKIIVTFGDELTYTSIQLSDS